MGRWRVAPWVDAAHCGEGIRLASVEGSAVTMPRRLAKWLQQSDAFDEADLRARLDDAAFDTLTRLGIVMPSGRQDVWQALGNSGPCPGGNMMLGVSRPGGDDPCGAAPALVRDRCAMLSFDAGATLHPGQRRHVLHPLPLVDAGDAPHPAWLSPLLAERGAQDRMIALGGDHTVTWHALAGLAASGRPVTLLHVDAHADCAMPEDPRHDRVNHASYVRHAVSALGVRAVIQYGVRALTHAADAASLLPSCVMQSLPCEDGDEAVTDAVARALAHDDGGVLAVSVDIDVIDPAEAPGVSFPEPGGMRFSALRALLRRVEMQFAPAYVDIVEVAETTPGPTSRIAGALLSDLLFARFGHDA